MPDQPRPVWLTREQRDALRVMFDNMIADSRRPLLDVIEAWDAAPADATGEVEVAIYAYDFPQTRRAWTAQERQEYAARAALVLRALGRPDA